MNNNGVYTDDWKNELHIQLITSLVNRQNTNDSIFEKIGYYYTCCAPAFLYKYCSDSDRTIENLKTNKIWFSAPCNFNDVFEVVPNVNYDIFVEDIKGKSKSDIVISKQLIDYNLILSTIPNMSERALNSDMRELIDKLSYIYKIDTDKMIDLILQSLNERSLIDKKKLRNLCGNYYRLENNGEFPNVIYNIQFV